ncbi:hypothetical protein [Fischerella thermalis]|uniref:hypothetical protein n=1 Tax=Fischerella thermalis TaxID=372787 RepID=UPI0015BE74CE|nr:hypothetical protein [Fischerella thermalis]
MLAIQFTRKQRAEGRGGVGSPPVGEQGALWQKEIFSLDDLLDYSWYGLVYPQLV